MCKKKILYISKSAIFSKIIWHISSHQLKNVFENLKGATTIIEYWFLQS
jgi:hypothetical protein